MYRLDMENKREVIIFGEGDDMIVVIDGKKYKTKLIQGGLYEKMCVKCKEIKTFECFNNDSARPDGKTSYCKICASKCAHDCYEKKRTSRNISRTRGRPRKVIEDDSISTPIC